MGHAHAHAQSHGEGEGTYFLDQLFTILVCGAIGLVAILMYVTGMISRILAEMFFIWVLLGGIAILVLAAIRAIAVWQLAGARRSETAQTNNHNHEHSHSHSHGHDHAHDGEDCGHEHGEDCGHEPENGHAHAHAQTDGDDDHGHDHGWAPWRYMVLAIPVFLYFLDLPRSGFSESRRDRELSAGELQQGSLRKNLALLAGGMAYRKPNPEERKLGFSELPKIAAVPSRHVDFDGDIGILRGQFAPLGSSDREFTLFRVNMTCCAADAVFMETRIIAPDPVNVPANQWVWVTGTISFQKNEKGKWVSVITLKTNDAIREAEPTNDINAF